MAWHRHESCSPICTSHRVDDLDAPRTDRISMRFALHMLLALVATAVLAVPSAFAQSLDALRADADASRATYEAAAAEFETARAAYEAQVSAVEAQKDDVLESPLRAIELQAALRNALQTSETVAALDASMREARDAMRDDLVALHDALHDELEALGAALDEASPEDRRAIAAEVERLVAELDAVDAPLPPFEPVPLDAILADLEDSSDALRAAADELADNEDRLARHLDSIRDELQRVEAREALRERATRMAVEDRFFDDGVARRPSRSNATATAAEDTANGGTSGRSTDDGDQAGAPTRGDADVAAGGVDDTDDFGGAESGGAGSGGEGFDAEAPPESDEMGGGGVGDPLAGGDDQDGVIVDVPVTTWDTELLAPTTDAAPGVDPTLLDRLDEAVDGDDRRRRRGRTGELRALEAEVQREIERLRTERSRVEAEADALEDAGF